MRFLGILIILAGWVIAVSGLFIAAGNVGRALFACVGIAVSLFGILGVLNRYYLARAIWNR